MAKKEGKETLELRVTAEHVATPHGIELRRKDGKVIEVRTQAFASTETIGAKTIENIIREAGSSLPVPDQDLTILFSPHTGDVIAVVATTAEAEPTSEQETSPATV